VFCAWFDDLEIRHKGAIIAQETHYDPWGLELVGIGRQGLNRFTFNGQSEKQANLADGKGYFYETDFRSYDATLGRFHAYDLMASGYSRITPYHFALNNPISANDPTGLWVSTGEDPKLKPFDPTRGMDSGGNAHGAPRKPSAGEAGSSDPSSKPKPSSTQKQTYDFICAIDGSLLKGDKGVKPNTINRNRLAIENKSTKKVKYYEFNDPFGRSVLATTYQMASVHLRFAKQNNTELKTEIGFWLGVLCLVWRYDTKGLSLHRKHIMTRGNWS